MRTVRLATAALMAAGLVAVLVVFGLAGPRQITPSLSVQVVAREFSFEPKEMVARAGEITFTIKNAGIVEHDFVVETGGKQVVAQAKLIRSGGSAQMKVRLTPGRYTVYCSLPGHREAGMQAVLTVVP